MGAGVRAGAGGVASITGSARLGAGAGGVMGVATFTPDEAQLRQEFQQLRGYFEHLKTTYFASEPAFCEISMGMSGDYPMAVAEGSTLVRVGSAIFGSRG